jgi:hypothetical protein
MPYQPPWPCLLPNDQWSVTPVYCTRNHSQLWIGTGIYHVTYSVILFQKNIADGLLNLFIQISDFQWKGEHWMVSLPAILTYRDWYNDQVSPHSITKRSSFQKKWCTESLRLKGLISWSILFSGFHDKEMPSSSWIIDDYSDASTLYQYKKGWLDTIWHDPTVWRKQRDELLCHDDMKNDMRMWPWYGSCWSWTAGITEGYW